MSLGVSLAGRDFAELPLPGDWLSFALLIVSYAIAVQFAPTTIKFATTTLCACMNSNNGDCSRMWQGAVILMFMIISKCVTHTCVP